MKFYPVIVMIGLLSYTNLSQSAEQKAETELPGRPANVSDIYIPTPTGYFHPDCITTVEDGESVRGDGAILKLDGTIKNVQSCKHNAFTKDGNEIQPHYVTTGKDSNTIGGWEASISSSMSPSNNVIKIVGEWTVPDHPFDYKGQTLFIFNSISTDNTIIQPVLGYNQADIYGPQWTIASWMVSGPNATKTKNTRVQPGDIIRGTFERNLPRGVDPQTVKTWQVKISVIKDGLETKSESFSVELPNSNYWTFDQGAYETYGATLCSQISKDREYNPYTITFKTKYIESLYADSGTGQRYTSIADRKCGVKTSIENWGINKIHY